MGSKSRGNFHLGGNDDAPIWKALKKEKKKSNMDMAKRQIGKKNDKKDL